MINYWKIAADKVREIATKRNLPVYWGSGYPIEKPHIVAVTGAFLMIILIYNLKN